VSRDADADLLRAQVGLTQGDLSRQLNAAHLSAETAALRVATLEEQLHLQDQNAAALQAEIGGHSADADLLRAQVGLTQDDLTRQLNAAQLSAETATLRVTTLEEQLRLQDQNAAAQIAGTEIRDIDTTLLRAQVGLVQTGLTARFADRQEELDLLRTQVALLQGGLALALTTAPQAEQNQASQAWDKALASALASARSEADRRARLESELDSVRAKLQLQSRRDEDQEQNRKMFSLLARESTAALDEVARLANLNRA
jgi:hypothetical protein